MPLVRLKNPLILTLLVLSSCSGPQLNWNGTIYVGSSKDEAVIGKVDGQPIVVKCSDPKFDSMTCTDDIKGLINAYDALIKSCKKW